jgi:hypothetical protein
VLDIEAALDRLVIAQENVLLNVPPARVVVRRRDSGSSASQDR